MYDDHLMSDEELFGLLDIVAEKERRAAMPRQQVLLSKALHAVKPKPKAVKAKAPAKLLVAVRAKPSKNQLLNAIEGACIAGHLSGHDGLAASELVGRGQDLPQGTLVAIGLGA